MLNFHHVLKRYILQRVSWIEYAGCCLIPSSVLFSQVSSRYTHLMAACGQINQIPKSSLTGSMMHCSIQHCCWAQFSRVLKNTQVAMYCFSSCFWMNSATIIHWQIICKSFYWCCSIKSWMETVPLKTPSFGWSKNSQSESKPMSVMSEKEKLKQRNFQRSREQPAVSKEHPGGGLYVRHGMFWKWNNVLPNMCLSRHSFYPL